MKVMNLLERLDLEFPVDDRYVRHSIVLNQDQKKLQLNVWYEQVSYTFFLEKEDFEKLDETIAFIRFDIEYKRSKDGKRNIV